MGSTRRVRGGKKPGLRSTTYLLTGYIVLDRATLAMLSEVNKGKVSPRAWRYYQVFPERREALAWRRVNAPGMRSMVTPVVVVGAVTR